MNLELIITEDGSHSVMNKTLNEGYHSRYGAISESSHVYIETGLSFAANNLKSINLLEIGLGTGLNALLSYKWAITNNIKINYTGIEPFPVPAEILEELNYPKIENFPDANNIFRHIHQCKSNQLSKVNDFFSFIWKNTTIEKVPLNPDYYNVVYFDAFAPQIQPQLWTEIIFSKIFKAMKNGGILTTYSAKGSVRRNLQTAGFTVERLSGPKGKREILRALKKKTSD